MREEGNLPVGPADDVQDNEYPVTGGAGEEKMKKSDMIAFCDLVAREAFQALTEEEQAAWGQTAVHEQKEAMKQWKKEMETSPGTDPKSRQIAIQGLIKFMQPILDLVCEATGWKASLICGGPEPAQGGLLNILSIHSGATSGDVKMSFGRAERIQFRKTMVPIYGTFLQKCYSPVECRSQALAKEAGFVPMSDLDLENEGAAIDPVSSTQPPPIRLGSFPALSAQGSIPPGQFPRAASTPASLATTAPVGVLKKGSDMAPAAATTTAPSTAPTAPTAPTALTAPSAAPARVSTVAPTPPSPAPNTGPTTAPTPPTTSVEPSPNMAALAAPPAAVSTTQPTTTPAAQSHATRVINEVDEGMKERETEGSDEVMGDNPFPFNIPEEPSPPLVPDSLGGVSCNPTPLPSPCASPQPAPRLALAPHPSPSTPPPALSAVAPSPRPALAPHPSPPAPPPALSAAAPGPTRCLLRGPKEGINGSKGEREDREIREKHRSKRTLEESENASSSSGPVVKRKRTSTVRPVQSEAGFTVPDDAPQWFKNAFEMLTSLNGGKQWDTVLGYWGCFEVQAGYKEVKKLGAIDQPNVIKDWIKRACSTTWRPNIRDSVVLDAEVKRWWVGLQPKWHGGEWAMLSERSEGNWDELNRPGLNGLLSVAAALFFWGGALNNPSVNQEWLEVVEDLELALSKVIIIDTA